MNKTKLQYSQVFLFICGFFFLQSIYAQNLKLDDCGIENTVLLNECEANYFNEILEEQRGAFDFEGKRIAFAEGNWGARVSSKKGYFKRHGKPRYEQNSNIANQLLILTKEEKLLLPQYDAILVSWSKLTVHKKSRAKLIKRLQRMEKKSVKSKMDS